MISNKNDVNKKIMGILKKLNNARDQPPANKSDEKIIRIDILNLIFDTVTFLNQKNPLSPWEKSHIVVAINALNWNWYYLALNSLKLAITDESQIDPNNTYKQEIIDLSTEQIIDYINQLKITS
jgi:hypothetical protein